MAEGGGGGGGHKPKRKTWDLASEVSEKMKRCRITMSPGELRLKKVRREGGREEGRERRERVVQEIRVCTSRRKLNIIQQEVRMEEGKVG
jgi:hypothetical protein